MKYFLLIWVLLFSQVFISCKGSYAGPGLSGDFSSSEHAEQFINLMVKKHGFNRTYLLGLFSRVKNKPAILKKVNRPVASIGVGSGSWNRYRDRFINPAKINKAVKFWRQHKNTLAKAQRQYGVPAELIVAIISMETNFGGFLGESSVIDSISTLALGTNRRQDYFLSELEYLLIMCRSEQLDPLALKGSFAGGMGYGQFMPGSFLRYMVDYDGDGKKDMWNLADTIGSIANYFKLNGWVNGKIGVVPAQARGNLFNKINYGWRYPYKLRELAEYGITPEKEIMSEDKLYFIKLTTYKGHELWLGGHNFYVITRYNNSSKYAVTAYLLAKKIKKKFNQSV